MCKGVVARALGISHHHLHRQSKQEVRDRKLRGQIEKTWEEHPSYGQTRLSIHLKINKKRISRAMKGTPWGQSPQVASSKIA